MNLTPEQKATGNENFNEAVSVTRRSFLQQSLLAGAASGIGVGAMYFGYEKVADPVRIGIIGTGDEGNVLIGACNLDYVDVVAIADIRPFNIHRAFHGDYASDAALAVRPGLMAKYDWKTEAEAKKHVKVYDKDYRNLLADPDVEAVIIALPLHLHDKVAIEAMEAGKHVLTEKLMGQTVMKCKLMGRKAAETGKLLATGHQRHYSVLYDNAAHLVGSKLLGEISYIRAQWHRGNLPGGDSWAQPLPGGQLMPDGSTYDKIADGVKSLKDQVKKAKERLASDPKSLKSPLDPKSLQRLEAKLLQYQMWDADKAVEAKKYDYEDAVLENGYQRSALEELARWRLWNRTGNGLMAELGSHQLDAASIFISALRNDGKKAHPLTVHAVGGRHTFPLDRDAADHVYCMYEFAGPGYDPATDADPTKKDQTKKIEAAYKKRYGYYDKVAPYPNMDGIPAYDEDSNKKIVVTYSTIMGNGYGGYGEVVMGTKGTLVLEREKEIMLFKSNDTSSRVRVKNDGGGPSMDTQASGPPTAAIAKAAAGPVSRGYQEEIEHWAWCIRNPALENQPKCKPDVALGDAVIALTTKLAMDRNNAGHGGYVKFKDSWFDIDSDETPEEDLKI